MATDGRLDGAEKLAVDEEGELTGMPQIVFFAWFTSPSTILAAVLVSMGRKGTEGRV